MTAASPATHGRGQLILCVEDEDDLRSDLVEELEEAGYAVVEARDGAQATEQLEAIRPDLILCDINMPGIGGYELLERLRRLRPQLAEVPFVFLTALADPREVVEGKRRGADDYLVKPVDFDLMLATIEARLRQVAAIRQSVQSEMGRLRAALADLDGRVERETFKTVCQTFDYISLGIVVLDGDSRVLFANRAARALAEGNDGLSLTTTLGVDDPLAGKRLHKAMALAVSSDADNTDLPACVSIPRPSGSRDILALVFALERGADLQGPAAAIFLSDPELRSKVPDGILAALFGLTPTEAQVATLLAEGNRADQIAELMKVSPTTVAFHIRNLLGKTGTSRQADLIALLLAGPMAMSFD
ncbi:MAG: response regulator [Rhizobiaceae bacterium]